MPSPHRHPRPLAAVPIVALVAAGFGAVHAADTTRAFDETLLTRHVLGSLSWEPTEEPPLAEPVDDPDLRASRSTIRRPVVAAPPDPAPVAADPAPPAPSASAAKPSVAPKPTPSPSTPRPSTLRPSTPPAAARPANPAPAAPRPAAPVPPPAASSAPPTAADKGLAANAQKVSGAVRAAYPQVTIGGLRAGGGDHATGKAVDLMVPSSAVGDAVAAFVQSRASQLGVAYVIWRQRIWNPGGGGWRAMEDRGSATANHMDHVHVSVS